jgi:integrase
VSLGLSKEGASLAFALVNPSIKIVKIEEDPAIRFNSRKFAGGNQDGTLFRAIDRHGRIASGKLSPQAVFWIVANYSEQLQLRIRPHDLRRSFARFAHLGSAPIEQIQLSLDHASIITTELYLGIEQDLSDASCDRLGLDFASGAQEPVKQFTTKK